MFVFFLREIENKILDNDGFNKISAVFIKKYSICILYQVIKIKLQNHTFINLH